MEGRNLQEEITTVYEGARMHRAAMDLSAQAMRELEMGAKLSNKDEFIGAKNSESRSVMLTEWLEDEPEYLEAQRGYQYARVQYRQAILKIEELKLQVALAGADAVRERS